MIYLLKWESISIYSENISTIPNEFRYSVVMIQNFLEEPGGEFGNG